MKKYKLNKPKSFEASESIKANGMEIANLKRSGIIVSTVFLIGANGKWNEVAIPEDTAHLVSIANYIEVNKLTLVDFGLSQEEATHDLTHDDFMTLSEDYDFDYIQIGRLHKYERENNLPWSMFEKRLTLAMLQRDRISIDEYITSQEQAKRERLILSESKIKDLSDEDFDKAI